MCGDSIGNLRGAGVILQEFYVHVLMQMGDQYPFHHMPSLDKGQSWDKLVRSKRFEGVAVLAIEECLEAETGDTCAA